jgi:hypothetical protein
MTIDRTICYICCEPGADSEDHVIPECFFPKPAPKNLLKLPAHKRCHGGLPEGWLRNLLVPLAAGSPSKSATALYSGPVWRAFENDIGLHRETLSGLVRSEEAYSTDGVYLGSGPAIHFDRKRVYPSLEKMVRGLYLHHTGELLPRDIVFQWVEAHKLHFGRFPVYRRAAAPGLVYDEVFECQYFLWRDREREGSAWWLRFYRTTDFNCFVSPRDPGTREESDPNRTRSVRGG